MKIRVLTKSIKESSNSYYSTRSKKIINLIQQLEKKSEAKLTLSGCLIFNKKNHIIVEKYKKS